MAPRGFYQVQEAQVWRLQQQQQQQQQAAVGWPASFVQCLKARAFLQGASFAVLQAS